MGVEGNKILASSDHVDSTAILSSHVDLIKTSSDQDDHHHDENITININIPRSLKPIKIKVESLPPSADVHRIVVDVADQGRDEDGGPKTPTGEQHKIPTIEACPPAPKKVWRPLKRRRTLFHSENGGLHANVQRPMRLVELSHEDIESLFPRRSTNTNTDHHRHHNNSTHHDHQQHNHHRAGNIKKVSKANFTSLMSFR